MVDGSRKFIALRNPDPNLRRFIGIDTSSSRNPLHEIEFLDWLRTHRIALVDELLLA